MLFENPEQKQRARQNQNAAAPVSVRPQYDPWWDDFMPPTFQEVNKNLLKTNL